MNDLTKLTTPPAEKPMTNDTKAPNRIYLAGDVQARDGMFPRCFENPKYASEPSIEYIRHDLHLVLVAAAYEDMAKRHEVEAKLHADIGNTDRYLIYKQISKYTRSLTPDDARAALAELKGKADE